MVNIKYNFYRNKKNRFLFKKFVPNLSNKYNLSVKNKNKEKMTPVKKVDIRNRNFEFSIDVLLQQKLEDYTNSYYISSLRLRVLLLSTSRYQKTTVVFCFAKNLPNADIFRKKSVNQSKIILIFSKKKPIFLIKSRLIEKNIQLLNSLSNHFFFYKRHLQLLHNKKQLVFYIDYIDFYKQIFSLKTQTNLFFLPAKKNCLMKRYVFDKVFYFQKIQIIFYPNIGVFFNLHNQLIYFKKM